MLAVKRSGMGDGEEDFLPGVYESAPAVGGGSATGSGNNWGQFLQGLMAQWSTAGASRLQAPNVQRNADGSLILRNTPNTNYSGVGISSNIPGWVWLAGGVGLVFVLAMNKKGKG